MHGSLRELGRDTTLNIEPLFSPGMRLWQLLMQKLHLAVSALAMLQPLWRMRNQLRIAICRLDIKIDTATLQLPRGVKHNGRNV